MFWLLVQPHTPLAEMLVTFTILQAIVVELQGNCRSPGMQMQSMKFQLKYA